MGIFSFRLGGRGAENDMARANARPVDTAKIRALVDRLDETASDAKAFKALLAQLTSDKTISSQELIMVAQAFAGRKPKSRKDAMTAIAQERLRLSHAKAKGESAKTRVW